MQPHTEKQDSRSWLRAVQVGVATIVVLVTVVTAIGITRLQFDDDPKAAFARDDSDFHLLEEFYEQFDSDDKDVLVVVRGKNLVGRSALEQLRDMHDEIAAASSVESVFSVFELWQCGRRRVPLVPSSDESDEGFSAARDRLLEHPFARNRLITSNAQTMLMVARIRGDHLSAIEIQHGVSQLRSITERHSAKAPWDAQLTGIPALRVELFMTTRQDMVRFTAIAAAIAMLIGYLVFGNVADLLLCSTGALVGVVWLFGTLGFLGINIQVLESVIPALLFVIGFANATHIVRHFHTEQSQGKSIEGTVVSCWQKIGVACLLAAVTSALGFGSLAISDTSNIQRFGIISAIGVLCTFVSVMTITPLLATSRINQRGLSATKLQAPRFVLWILDGLNTLTMSFPRSISCIGLLLCCAMLAISTQIDFEMKWGGSIPQDSSSFLAGRHCDKAFGGSTSVYVMLQWPEDEKGDPKQLYRLVDEIHAILDNTKEISSPVSVLTMFEAATPRGKRIRRDPRIIWQVPKVIRHRVINYEQRRMLVAAFVPDISILQLEPCFQKIEKQLTELEKRFPAYQLYLTGSTVVSIRNVRELARDLVLSLVVAVSLIMLILLVVFRSITYGILSGCVNLFPLGLIASVFVLQSRLIQPNEAMCFSVCFGLAVDDTIHFLMHFRQELRLGKSVREAITETMHTVGHVLVLTSCVLLAGFLTLGLSKVPTIQSFGLVCSLGVAGALLADLVLLPALLLVVPPHRLSPSDPEEPPTN